MKRELTPELREKFYAQYYGQKVLHMDDESEMDYVFPVVKSTFFTTNHDNYLVLRSILSITDDESVEVAKIWRPDRDVSYHSVKYGRAIIDGLDHLMVGFFMFGQITDYLRSVGVALPFMGHTVEELMEAGWVKLVKEVQS